VSHHGEDGWIGDELARDRRGSGPASLVVAIHQRHLTTANTAGRVELLDREVHPAFVHGAVGGLPRSCRGNHNGRTLSAAGGNYKEGREGAGQAGTLGEWGAHGHVTDDDGRGPVSPRPPG
jgi:hypothetical protein